MPVTDAVRHSLELACVDKEPMGNVRTDGGQAAKALEFGCGGGGFELSNRRSTSPLGSPLLAGIPLHENDGHCKCINNGSKDIKG